MITHKFQIKESNTELDKIVDTLVNYTNKNIDAGSINSNSIVLQIANPQADALSLKFGDSKDKQLVTLRLGLYFHEHPNFKSTKKKNIISEEESWFSMLDQTAVPGLKYRFSTDTTKGKNGITPKGLRVEHAYIHKTYVEDTLESLLAITDKKINFIMENIYLAKSIIEKYNIAVKEHGNIKYEELTPRKLLALRR